MHLDHEIDDDSARGTAFGLIVLEVDETAEPDFRRLMPATGTRLYVSRVDSADEVTADTLPHMATTLPTAAAMLPQAAGLSVIAYACTSGATVIGEDAVARLIGEGYPGTRVTNPLSALKAACAALGVRRLGLVSPYVAEVSAALRERLAEAGVATTAFGSFERKEERLVARISHASILAALDRVGGSTDCEAVFASCTNLRATDVLVEAEQRFGKPVLTSNQVLAWHMLRLAGIDAAMPAAGALGRHLLAAPAAVS